MNQLSVKALAAWLDDPSRPQPVLLDVREAWEVQTAALPGIVHVPMRELPARVAELDAAREIVSICHHGGRSMQVALFLERQGFRVHNLAGGMDAWSREVDPAVPRY
ncbi:MAG: sulfurtransferase [Burkholderiales bacterium]|nr:sulfurtransferase [Burkholderiales bacterium]